MKTYREKILELEKELELESFTYNGWEIWPLIRLSIILARPKTNKVSGTFKKKLKFLVLGIIEYVKWKLGFWPKSKNIFLTSSHYKVKEKGTWYDRIIDPFLSWLDSKKKDYVVFEFTNSFSYLDLNYSNRSIHIQPVIYFLSFFWKFQYKFFKRGKIQINGNVDLFNELSRSKDLYLQLDENFHRRLFLLEKQSKLFEKILSKMSATHVGVVCYYDFKSIALIWAANRLKIRSIDFQHGVQHSLHLAYAQWPKAIVAQNVFIPSHFYVWNQFSLENIAPWHNEEKIINGGNKWFRDRISFSERNVILYTVQPLEDPIPSSLIEAIKNYAGKKQLFMRLHPQQLGEIEKIENHLKQNNVLHKVNIKEATNSPLTEILAKTALHITKSSSVAIEASYFHIPTIFLTERGKTMYEPMLSANLLNFADEPDSLLKYFNSLKDSPEENKDKESLPEDNFEKIEKFYTQSTF